jgi:hypothetical protein
MREHCQTKPIADMVRSCKIFTLGIALAGADHIRDQRNR